MPESTAIPRKQLDHADFLTNHFRRSPVVLEGAMADWPAATRWTPQYLKRHYGHAAVTPERYDSAAKRTFLEQMLASDCVESTLGDYLDRLHEHSVNYALREEHAVFDQCPGMLEEMNHCRPFWGRRALKRDYYRGLWIGPGGYRTGLHADFANILLFQFHGRKRFLIYAPDQTEWLYPEVPTGAYCASREVGVSFQELVQLRTSLRWAAANPFQPDHDAHPLFRQAVVREAVIGPGDAIYLPYLWWHAVEALDDAISVSIGLDIRSYRRATGVPRRPGETAHPEDEALETRSDTTPQ